MLGSYRGIVVAVAGWLILAAAPTPRDRTQEQANQSAAKIGHSLDSIAAAQNKIAKATNTGEYEKPCRDGQPNYDSDLCAQWYAASAARDAANWAAWSFYVGIVGALGIIIALGLTWHSNWIARDTAKRQLRAYLAVKSAGPVLVRTNSDLVVEIGLVNTGQTPAMHVDGFWNISILESNYDFKFPELMKIEENGSYVGQSNQFIIRKNLGKLNKTTRMGNICARQNSL
jgi:hypothetical protein